MYLTEQINDQNNSVLSLFSRLLRNTNLKKCPSISTKDIDNSEAKLMKLAYRGESLPERQLFHLIQ